MTCKIDHYSLSETLGRGVSATVKLARREDNPKVECAAKIFDLGSSATAKRTLAQLQTEIKVQRQLDHIHIVKVVDH